MAQYGAVTGRKTGSPYVDMVRGQVPFVPAWKAATADQEYRDSMQKIERKKYQEMVDANTRSFKMQEDMREQAGTQNMYSNVIAGVGLANQLGVFDSMKGRGKSSTPDTSRSNVNTAATPAAPTAWNSLMGVAGRGLANVGKMAFNMTPIGKAYGLANLGYNTLTGKSLPNPIGMMVSRGPGPGTPSMPTFEASGTPSSPGSELGFDMSPSWSGGPSVGGKGGLGFSGLDSFGGFDNSYGGDTGGVTGDTPGGYDSGWGGSGSGYESSFSGYDSFGGFDNSYGGNTGGVTGDTPGGYDSGWGGSSMGPSGSSDGYGTDGTVLCTELHRQGLLPDEIYQADSAYGKTVDDHTMAGYQLWGRPLAKLMARSGLVTKMLTPLIRAWAYNMHHKVTGKGTGNRLGEFMERIGLPICRAIGQAADLKTWSIVYSDK